MNLLEGLFWSAVGFVVCRVFVGCWPFHVLDEIEEGVRHPLPDSGRIPQLPSGGSSTRPKLHKWKFFCPVHGRTDGASVDPQRARCQTCELEGIDSPLERAKTIARAADKDGRQYSDEEYKLIERLLDEQDRLDGRDLRRG